MIDCRGVFSGTGSTNSEKGFIVNLQLFNAQTVESIQCCEICPIVITSRAKLLSLIGMTSGKYAFSFWFL